MEYQAINTDQAPAAIGPYSQAIKSANTVYLAGQIGLNPQNMILMEDFNTQAHQIFSNLTAVCVAAGGKLNNIVKLNVYLTELNNFTLFNSIMEQYFNAPYPARAVVVISALPKNALLEIDGIMVVS